MTVSSATAATLPTPDGELHYELRGTGPLAVLVGAPMDARPFAPLAGLLAADHTVLTTDPRGINRSRLRDPDSHSTPEQRADDLARLIARVDAGPAAVLGSSGGAVSVLALAQAHPERVHTVIAHEPPLRELLDDRDGLRVQTEHMIELYRSGDRVEAWRVFMRVAGMNLPEPVFQDVFGATPQGQDAADERFQFEHMLWWTTQWQPDVEKLRGSSARVVVGIGEASTGELCDRTSRALAARLGTEPAMFPGGHIGFADEPAAFAARLRQVLSGRP